MYYVIITILLIILFIILLIIISKINTNELIKSNTINLEKFRGGGHGGSGFSGGSIGNIGRAGFSRRNIGRSGFDRSHYGNHQNSRHQGWGYYGNGGRSLWNGYYGVSPIYNYSYWDSGYYPEPIYVDQPVIIKEVPVYINNNES